MRILHLLSNNKWTERAEPVVNLVGAQAGLGCTTTFVCGRWTLDFSSEHSVAQRARSRGLETVVLEMNKHFRIGGARHDIPRLRQLVREKQVDIMHVHMDNAHLLAALALRGQKQSPIIIRSSYEVAGPARGIRSSFLNRCRIAGMIVIGTQAHRTVQKRFGLSPHQVVAIEPGIDVDFFDPDRAVPNVRIEHGFEPYHFVVGVVSRIRPDRRLDIPIDAVHALSERVPNLRLLVIGRGESVSQVQERIGSLSLNGKVVLAGYRSGEDLVSAFRAMDVLAYPVPGTDQSCRTIREAMAAGVPVIGSRTGFVPSLVDDGVTGQLVEQSASGFAKAIAQLHDDRDQLLQMRSRCLREARQRFSLELQAQRTIDFYKSMLAWPSGRMQAG